MSTAAFTPFQRGNVENIVAHAKAILRQHKDEAVRNGDIEASISIASREAQIDSYLLGRGVEVPDPCPRCAGGRMQVGQFITVCCCP